MGAAGAGSGRAGARVSLTLSTGGRDIAGFESEGAEAGRCEGGTRSTALGGDQIVVARSTVFRGDASTFAFCSHADTATKHANAIIDASLVVGMRGLLIDLYARYALRCQRGRIPPCPA